METEPGGEQSQYESIKTFTEPHAKQPSTFGDGGKPAGHVDNQKQDEKRERGEKTADNIRYGESISEHGFGGETTGVSGEANQESGYGTGTSTKLEEDEAAKTRREQGYGPGSGVGA